MKFEQVVPSRRRDRWVARTVVALFVTGAGFADVGAQTDAQGPGQARQRTEDVIQSRLEDSYILATHWLSSGLPPLIFEARPAPHFLTSLCPRNCAIVADPTVVLRMFDAPSLPVRTPSYMPRLTVHVWPRELASRRGVLTYFSFSVAHYSNGQSGPLIDTLTGGFNTSDGSFSTNFVEVALHQGQLDSVDLVGFTLSLRVHPRGWMDAPLRDTYGWVRPSVALEAIRQLPAIGRSRLRAELGYLVGRVAPALDGGLDRVRLGFTASSQPRRAGQLGLILHYYEGQDYYNVWFGRRIRALRIGIVGSRLEAVRP